MNDRATVVAALLGSVVLAGCGAGEEPARAPDAPVSEAGVAFEGCAADIPYSSVGQSVMGDAGVLSAIVLDAVPLLPAKYENTWTIEIAGASGEPLQEASVDQVETFMPLHGHPGVPEASFEPLPESTRFAALLHFSMRGHWEVRIDARSGSLVDHVVFHVCIEE